MIALLLLASFLNESAMLAAVTRGSVVVTAGHAQGSGTIVAMRDGHLYVLTAAHVVDTAQQADVLAAPVSPSADTQKQTGSVVSCSRTFDLALVKIKPVAGAIVVLPAVTAPAPFSRAWSVGTPHGQPWSISTGFLHGARYMGGFVAPGSSGGAVVDGSGSLVGVQLSITPGVPQLAYVATWARIIAFLSSPPTGACPAEPQAQIRRLGR